MKKIKDEIARIEGAKGNVVLVNKKSYLALLKELSVLRFKVHRAENWETPAAVVSVVRRGYMYQYWYPENKPAQNKGEHKMAEQKKNETVEVKVAAEKVAAFQKYLEENKISGFGLQDFLTCCIPAGVPHFEPALVIAILNQIQGLLTATYPEIMKHLWEK